MNKLLLGRLIAVAAAIFSTNGWTYETIVHETMTENAFTSAYPDPNQLFRRLGIRADELFAQPFSRKRNALDWIKQGSNSEDSATRPAYHFYDPLSGKGLNGNVVSSVLCPSSTCTLETRSEASCNGASQLWQMPIQTPNCALPFTSAHAFELATHGVITTQ